MRGSEKVNYRYLFLNGTIRSPLVDLHRVDATAIEKL